MNRKRVNEDSIQEYFSVTVAEKNLDTIRTESAIYVGVSSICRALGIDHKPQTRRIKASFRWQQFSLPTSGGLQPTICIALESLSDWLKKIHPSTPTEEGLKLLLYFQDELPNIIRTKLSLTSLVPWEEPQELLTPPIERQLTIVEEHYVVSAGEEENALKADYLPQFSTAIPQTDLHPTVYTRLYEEDTAVREGYLAARDKDKWHWQTSNELGQRPFYIASNKLEVYVSHPNKPVALAVALQRIGQLSMRTVITARIVYWLWNLRRKNPDFAAEGWVLLRVEDILLLRGVQMHSRPLISNSEIRKSDGYYEDKYKEQVYEDLRLLNNTSIRRYVTTVGQDQRERTFYNEWPYLYVHFVMERLSGGESDRVVGIAVKAGEWMPKEMQEAFHRFTEVDKRVFQLDMRTDQHAIFLALYLVERWRQQAQQSLQYAQNHEDPIWPYSEPIRMQELLESSVIDIDWKHLTARFVPRIEAALFKLYDRKILGAPPCCITPIDKTRNWSKDWLESQWILLPSLDEPEQSIQQQALPGEIIDAPQLPAPRSRRIRKKGNTPD